MTIAHPSCPKRTDINMSEFKLDSTIPRKAGAIEVYKCEKCGLEIMVAP